MEPNSNYPLDENWKKLEESKVNYPKFIRIDPKSSLDIFQCMFKEEEFSIFIKNIVDPNLEKVIEELSDEIVQIDRMATPISLFIIRLLDNNFKSYFNRIIAYVMDNATETNLEHLQVTITQAKQKYAFSEFSRMNNRWNRMRSEHLHAELIDDNALWHKYHKLFNIAKESWEIIPVDIIIDWLKQRENRKYVIGDFGCGEADIAEKLRNIHLIHSFDHIASKQVVKECDISKVPLDDRVLDVVVFSLSLMGSNFTDYLREAYRTLKIDGIIHIVEAQNRFGGPDGEEYRDERISEFVKGLEQLGFERIQYKYISKFVHIIGSKGSKVRDEDVELKF